MGNGSIPAAQLPQRQAPPAPLGRVRMLPAMRERCSCTPDLVEQFRGDESRKVFRKLLSEHPRKEDILRWGGMEQGALTAEKEALLEGMAALSMPALAPAAKSLQKGELTKAASGRSVNALARVKEQLNGGSESLELMRRCTDAQYILVDAIARRAGFRLGARVNYRPGINACTDVLNVTPEKVEKIAGEFESKPGATVQKYYLEFGSLRLQHGQERAAI